MKVKSALLNVFNDRHTHFSLGLYLISFSVPLSVIYIFRHLDKAPPAAYNLLRYITEAYTAADEDQTM